jgi:hypothetical protein
MTAMAKMTAREGIGAHSGPMRSLRGDETPVADASRVVKPYAKVERCGCRAPRSWEMAWSRDGPG